MNCMILIIGYNYIIFIIIFKGYAAFKERLPQQAAFFGVDTSGDVAAFITLEDALKRSVQSV